jgi:hypothetical protein
MDKLQPDELRTLIDALSGLPQFASVRERRAVVNQALGDYPSAAEILRWQEWDGSAMVVADELVRRLDGVEPAPVSRRSGSWPKRSSPRSAACINKASSRCAAAMPGGWSPFQQGRRPGTTIERRTS